MPDRPEEVLPAADTPCAHCPWRKSNHGKRSTAVLDENGDPLPYGWYSKKNREALWAQIRRGGGSMTCHPTDPSLAEGNEKVHDIAPQRLSGMATCECAGALICVQREMYIIQELYRASGFSEGTTELYRKLRPRGLTIAGVTYWFTQFMPFPLGPSRNMATPDLSVEDVETPGVPEWEGKKREREKAVEIVSAQERP